MPAVQGPRDHGPDDVCPERDPHGAYGPGMPKEGWDHSIDYLRRVLADVWGADLTVIERELTLVGVNPAMDAFAEPAALSRKLAEEAAREAGVALAAR